MTYPGLFSELLALLELKWNGLPDKPDETPFSTLCALWDFAAHGSLSLKPDGLELQDLEPESVDLIKNMVLQRIEGVPLAYLTGCQTYMGVNFYTSPDAMIPRKETELLGYAALDIAHHLSGERGALRALDLCTGCGNVALALAYYVPGYHGVASDISKNAVSLAERNAKGLALEKRVQFYTGDLYDPFSDSSYEHSFDLITCNPPYIASANTGEMASEISEFEPREAFDGGPFGVNFIMRLIRETPHYLKSGSWLIFEVGLGQGESVLRMLRKIPDYQKTESRTGENGQIRVLIAQTQ